jgi:hypothetical protein
MPTKQTQYQRHKNKVIKIAGHPITKRALVVKGIVSLSFGAYLIDHSFALPVSMIGNLVWLWVPAGEDIVTTLEGEL